MEDQGFDIEESIMYQDNLSVILFETNGRGSSTPQTKHIWSWYYMIKDKITVGDATLNHLPTESVMADHFTNPLQGSVFASSKQRSRKLLSTQLMWICAGIYHASISFSAHRSVLLEVELL